jgi:hypothetical protein
MKGNITLMKNNHTLEKERHYFSEHLHEWLIYYPGKYVLIRDEQFCGIFESIEDALAEGIRLCGKDSFLVRKIEKAEPAHVTLFPFGMFYGEYSISLMQT